MATIQLEHSSPQNQETDQMINKTWTSKKLEGLHIDD